MARAPNPAQAQNQTHVITCGAGARAPSSADGTIAIVSASLLAELSYDAGVRALDLQERAVEQLRSRTGILLAASSLTASFLGAQTIQHESGLSVLSGLALISLAVSVLLCVYVLLPKQVFEFSLNAPQVYESLFDLRDDEEEIRRRLAYWLEEFWQRNQDRIDELGRYFFAAAVALIVQLVFWTFALTANIS